MAVEAFIAVSIGQTKITIVGRPTIMVFGEITDIVRLSGIVTRFTRDASIIEDMQGLVIYYATLRDIANVNEISQLFKEEHSQITSFPVAYSIVDEATLAAKTHRDVDAHITMKAEGRPTPKKATVPANGRKTKRKKEEVSSSLKADIKGRVCLLDVIKRRLSDGQRNCVALVAKVGETFLISRDGGKES